MGEMHRAVASMPRRGFRSLHDCRGSCAVREMKASIGFCSSFAPYTLRQGPLKQVFAMLVPVGLGYGCGGLSHGPRARQHRNLQGTAPHSSAQIAEIYTCACGEVVLRGAACYCSHFPLRHWYLWFFGVHPDAQGQGCLRVRMISVGVAMSSL